jgi:hypothetical protein
VTHSVTHPMEEPTERIGLVSLVYGAPEGPMLYWDDKPRPDTTLTATGLVALSPDGRVYFSTLSVSSDKKPVGSDELRMVPVTAMLTIANGDYRDSIIWMLARRADPTTIELLDGHVPDEPVIPEGYVQTEGQVPEVIVPNADPERPPALRFDFPKVGGAWPNSFYEAVAVAYRWLVVIKGSRRPALDLAEKNGVPVTTVHRWIAEARRRGVLEPGVRGRAGS